ncbi:MAG TPA: hypothetical protein VGL35_05535 [Rhizomicrobium sp.]|jgi:hypothetical protein
MPQDSEVERCEHQDNSNIHCQPFPEPVSEEPEIHTDDDGCHRQHVKHDNYLSAHFSRVQVLIDGICEFDDGSNIPISFRTCCGQHMAGLPRIVVSGCPHHETARGNHREPIILRE